MADYTMSSQTGGFTSESDYSKTPGGGSNLLTSMTNVAGAAVSLALIVGVGVWGYKLLVRDVSGIPVVRAMQGEMRVRPENPGGQLAQHQGLSVNSVAAQAGDVAPANEIRLAPNQVEFAEEDIAIAEQTVAVSQQAQEQAALEQATSDIDVAGALQAGEVDELVRQLTQGQQGTLVAASAEAADIKPQPAVFTGKTNVRASLRPKKRPGGVRVIKAAASVAPQKTTEVDPASLPKGTRLVQLGAFDSPEIARSQWKRLTKQFGIYMDGKQRIVQKADSGGRIFYRLRAAGFDDLADARRFCSALKAEKADCIAVALR